MVAPRLRAVQSLSDIIADPLDTICVGVLGEKTKLLKMAEQLGRLQQVAALPYGIKDDAVKFLVITPRRRKRRIVPKEWPMPEMTDAQAAATDAEEEAGVKGKVELEAFAAFACTREVGDREFSVDQIVSASCQEA